MPYIGRSTDGFGVRNRFLYLASASDTSVSGADANGATLTFTDGAYVDVYLNGVLLKAGTDYNTNTANTIAGLSAMAANDEVTVIVYDVFTVGDMVSATSGGTFTGNVTHNGTVTFGSTVSGLDVNGTEIILDADGDTTITADTDDQIDIKIAGADDFQFTANTFTALSGSSIATNTISETTSGSGVTIDSVLLKDGDLQTGVNRYVDIRDADGHVSGRLRNVSGSNNALTIEADPDNSASGTFMSFKVDTSEKMRIDDSGNVGIGLSPSFTSGNGLHLADDFKIGFGAGGNSRPDFQLGYSTSSSTLELACGFGADDADIKFTASGEMQVAGNLDTNILVTNSKDGSATGLIRVDADATSYTGSTRAFVADFTGTDHSSAQIGFQLEGSAGIKGSIVSTGNTTCSYVTSSDERLKTDIEDLTDGLTTINKLRPRKFKWISEGEDAEYDHGFVAQELYEDYKSRAVIVGREDPTTDPWSVDGSKLVPMLVKALQEADAKIEALTLRVKTLEEA